MNYPSIIDRIKVLEEKEKILENIFEDDEQVTVRNNGYRVYPKNKYLLEWMYAVNDLTRNKDILEGEIRILNKKISEYENNGILNNSLFKLMILWIKHKRK